MRFTLRRKNDDSSGWWIALELTNIVGLVVPMDLYRHSSGQLQAVAGGLMVYAAFFVDIMDAIVGLAGQFDKN